MLSSDWADICEADGSRWSAVHPEEKRSVSNTEHPNNEAQRD